MVRIVSSRLEYLSSDPWLDEKMEPWLDENGNFLEVVPKPFLTAPFDIWEDQWCDLTFLRKLKIFKDMEVPTLSDSGYGYDLFLESSPTQKMQWEAEMKTLRREENIHRKMMMRLHPEWEWRRQKKKGRTARKRRWAREARVDRKFAAEINKKMPRRFDSVLVTPDYDEHVMENELPAIWKTSFWMMSFVDDLRDYKFVIVDKSKECFWPAEAIPKRTLGYELLSFMPVVPALSKRSGSICGLDREGFTETAAVRNGARKLRRTKSESDLSDESNHWNLLPDAERETYENDLELYEQLVECEIQDEIDRFGIDYFYQF